MVRMPDEEKNAEYKTVLGLLKERRRPVQFKCGLSAKAEYENLLQAVKMCFEVTALNKGVSSTCDYYLQQETKEWRGLIDVTGYIQDKEIVHLCCSSLSTVSEVGKLTVSMVYNYNLYVDVQATGKANDGAKKMGEAFSDKC